MKQLLISAIILISSLASFSQGKLIEDEFETILRVERPFSFTDGVNTVYITPVFKYTPPRDEVDIILNKHYKHNGYYTLTGFQITAKKNSNNINIDINTFHISIRSQDSIIYIHSIELKNNRKKVYELLNITLIDAIRISFNNSKIESLISDPNDKLYFVNLKKLLKEGNVYYR